MVLYDDDDDRRRQYFAFMFLEPEQGNGVFLSSEQLSLLQCAVCLLV